jgi:hypothetical protein
MMVFDTNWAGPGNRQLRGWIDFDLSTQMREFRDGGTFAAPVMVQVAPHIDIRFDIADPTSLTDQQFDIATKRAFDTAIQTGRLTFSSPLTWKRLNRFWSKFAHDAGSHSTQVYLYTPGDPDVPDFDEDELGFFHIRITGSASKINQTPGVLNSLEGGDTGRFTSLRFFQRWRQSTTADLGDLSPSTWEELGFGRYFFDVTEYGVASPAI